MNTHENINDTRDTASSASRQHFIETGRYLRQGESIEAGAVARAVTGAFKAQREIDSLTPATRLARLADDFEADGQHRAIMDETTAAADAYSDCAIRLRAALEAIS